VDRISLRDVHRLAKIIYDEWLSNPEKETFTVVDRLATAVSHEVAKFALYELLRVAERKEEYRDIHQVIVDLISGLNCEIHREKALDICRDIALSALSMRFRREEKKE